MDLTPEERCFLTGWCIKWILGPVKDGTVEVTCSHREVLRFLLRVGCSGARGEVSNHASSEIKCPWGNRREAVTRIAGLRDMCVRERMKRRAPRSRRK